MGEGVEKSSVLPAGLWGPLRQNPLSGPLSPGRGRQTQNYLMPPLILLSIQCKLGMAALFVAGTPLPPWRSQQMPDPLYVDPAGRAPVAKRQHFQIQCNSSLHTSTFPGSNIPKIPTFFPKERATQDVLRSHRWPSSPNCQAL